MKILKQSVFFTILILISCMLCLHSQASSEPSTYNENIPRTEDSEPEPVDISGVTFVGLMYLNRSSGAMMQGHSGIVLVTSENKGLLYNFTADGLGQLRALMGEDIEKKMITSTDPEGKYQVFFDIEEFKQTGHIQAKGLDGKVFFDKYDRYLYIPIKHTQAIALRNKAEKIRCDKAIIYNIYSNSCNHVAQQLLFEADEDLVFSPMEGDNTSEQLVMGTLLIKNGVQRFVAQYVLDRLNKTIPNASFNYGVRIAKDRGWIVATTGHQGDTPLPFNWNPFR